MFANRVPPDVAGHGFEGIGGTEHVVVVTLLPEASREGFPEFKGGVLLEEADEFAEVLQRVRALRQQVEVVWHGAERMEQEGVH